MDNREVERAPAGSQALWQTGVECHGTRKLVPVLVPGWEQNPAPLQKLSFGMARLNWQNCLGRICALSRLVPSLCLCSSFSWQNVVHSHGNVIHIDCGSRFRWHDDGQLGNHLSSLWVILVAKVLCSTTCFPRKLDYFLNFDAATTRRGEHQEPRGTLASCAAVYAPCLLHFGVRRGLWCPVCPRLAEACPGQSRRAIPNSSFRKLFLPFRSPALERS